MFNTMKRKMFFRLTAVCLVAVGVLIACTKDYSTDITSLQNQITELTNKVQKLQGDIDAGAVITDVVKGEDGITVKLSNNKEYKIENGARGPKGEAGKDAAVWTIGSDEYWYCDGVKTDKVARGAQGEPGTPGLNGTDGVGISNAVLNDDYTLTLTFTDGKTYKTPSIRGAQGEPGTPGLNGEDGEDGVGIESAVLNDDYTLTLTFTDGKTYKTPSIRGAQGEPGNDGNDGKDGDYFYPCTDKDSANYGYWIKVDGETGEQAVTTEQWLPVGTLTAVWDDDNQRLTIHNVEDADDNVVVINLATALQSLAVLPELWDATLGMPMATVYAITPSAYEMHQLTWLKAGANMAPLRDWHWPSDVTSSPYAWNVYFWMALYNSYLGTTGQKDNQDYTASWDINDASFSYNWRLAGKDWDYSALKAAVEDAIKDLSLRFDGTSQATWLTRQPPVSALQLKYRVNPAGAYAGDYKFRMIDRSLTVSTKAAGDKYNHAVSKLKVENAANDQWNATGYVDYFRYWADKPTEWFLHLAATKSALAWYYWDAFSGLTDVPNKPRAERDAMNLFTYFYNDYLGYSTTDRQVVNAMDKWQELNGLNYETIVALEASKDGYGDEAIVSNYAAVKLEYVYPIWTAYHREAADNTVARWPLAYNWVKYLNGSQALVHPNDYLTEGQEYDVAAHMRFADPYYGRLENLGFKVKYDYYVFCAENDEPDRGYAGPWGDTDDNQSGEHEIDFGAWDKVEVTSDGKVKTIEGVSGAIGKYVLIVADASIYNEAQGNYYRASVGRASHMGWFNDQVPVYDEFIGHYLMLIIPDSAKTINVEYDLGTFDYTKLGASATAPASLALEALNMDFEGFKNVYSQPVLTATEPDGYSATYAAADDMFSVALSNQVQIGPGQVTYTFTPSDPDKYSTLCYTIKWNVTIDWAALEPVLNEDYILYDEPGKLTKTIISPDPNDQYGNVRPDRKYPYVDSIVAVKGKEVDGSWKPQTSIREHIHEYGSYLEAKNNISNLSMHINWSNSRDSKGVKLPMTSAQIAPSGTKYDVQEMSMLEGFKEHELIRDYVVDMKITLANGMVQTIKSYIVRFICPIYMVVTDDVILETHTVDWCSDRAPFEIRETGTNALLASWEGDKQIVSEYAQKTYSSIFNNMQAPTWKSNADATFGSRLLYEDNTGWFYWNNLGTDLQVDKETTYDVVQDFPGIAKLAATGKIKILSTAHSHASHKEETSLEEVEPGSNAHATWTVIYE